LGIWHRICVRRLAVYLPFWQILFQYTTGSSIDKSIKRYYNRAEMKVLVL
jgi:hypothetical protein